MDNFTVIIGYLLYYACKTKKLVAAAITLAQLLGETEAFKFKQDDPLVPFASRTTETVRGCSIPYKFQTNCASTMELLNS